MSLTREPPVWPERLTLRDTKVIADEGQRIFSTSTGYGYERRKYVRADVAESRVEELKREIERWHGLFDEKHSLMLEQKGRAEAAEAELARVEANQAVIARRVTVDAFTLIDETTNLRKELARAREALKRGDKLVRAFLRYYNPNDLPEDASQQWQQLEHWCAALQEQDG